MSQIERFEVGMGVSLSISLLNKGVPKEVLQTLLGHRSIKTTEIYANWVRKEELELGTKDDIN